MAEGPKRIVIDRPFTDGYVSDLRPEQLGPRMAARLENMVFPRGVAERRRGWVYADGGSAIGSSGVHAGVAAVAFQRAGVTRRVVVLNGSGSSDVYHSTGVGLVSSPPAGGAGGYLQIPRAVYRDELILCSQDGLTPIVRYGGSAGFSRYQLEAGQLTSGERRITGMTPVLPSGFDNGAFAWISGGYDSQAHGAIYSFRVNSSTVGASEVSIERLTFAVTTAFNISYVFGFDPFGCAWPGVPVYDAGTITGPASNLVTGQGVKWNDPANVNMFASANAADAITIYDADGRSAMNRIYSVAATQLGVVGPNNKYATPAPYKIMRRMPFTDVAVFRGSFFGSGVKQQSSRLYYYPPGADIGLSPKAAAAGTKYTHTTTYVSSDPDKDFEMEWVDVPSGLDADPIVALLPTDSAMFVVKRSAVYRITGTYPYFRADKAGDAAGCLDIRSAITDETGVYWAGDTGIWTVRAGVPYNLAGGPNRPGILTEWRNVMAETITGPTYASTSWIVCGVAEGHLIVSVRTATGTARCFVMELKSERWCGVFTNVLPNAAWSSRIPGETDRLYVMQDVTSGSRRVSDLSPVFRPGAGGAVDGNSVAHLAVGHTGTSVFMGGELSRESRLVDVGVASRYWKPSGSPVGTVTVKVAFGDRVDGGGAVDTVETIGTVAAGITGAVHHAEFRPGVRGRRHQLRVEQTAVDSDESGFEVHEVSGLVRPLGVRR